MRSAQRKSKGPWLALGALAAASCLCCLFVGSAQAATYPAGAGAFDTGTEGWHTVGEPTCTLPLASLCEARGEFEGGAGNPPGSLAAKAKVIANVVGAFKAMVDFESPNFTATEGGVAQFHLERELVSTSVLDLTPTAAYAVSLLDRTNGGTARVLAGSASGSVAAFAAENASAALVPGHVYAISLSTETSSSVAGLGLIGSTALRFDNVALTTVSGGGGGSGGGDNPGGRGSAAGSGKLGALTDTRLLTLLRANGTASPLLAKGKRLFARVSCPAAVGRTCRIVAQGLLSRRKPATTRRVVKVAAGKGKRIALRVKPKARKRLAKRRRLLLREAVHAGAAKATVVRSRKLIRR